MLLLESKFTPNEDQEGFFRFVRGGDFPWFSLRTLDDNHSPFQFCHALMKRALSGAPEEGKINSNYFDYARNLFLDICEQNNVEVHDIYRMAFNCTTYSEQKYVDPHKDHEFDHKVFIMYINDFTYGQTILMDESYSPVYTIRPEPYKFIIFNNCYHTHTFCDPDQLRIVMVATFAGELK